MKHMIKPILAIALVSLILLISSCSDILQEESQVRIDLILDDHGFSDTTEFLLTGIRAGTTESITASLGSGLEPSLMHLTPGTWTFNVQALRGDDIIEGEGSATITVQPGRLATLPIDITYGYVAGFCLNYEGAPAPPESIEVTYAAPYGTLPTAERTGYTFAGWYDGTGEDAQTVTCESVYLEKSGQTLYAHWEANSYTVSFDSNEGSSVAAVTATYDSTYGILPAPIRTGYTFEGWFTSETDNNGDGTQITSSSVVSITSDALVYAQWSANSYTLSFDSNGGSSVESGTATYDSTYGTLPVPTRAGYTFSGWFTSETDNNGDGNQITSGSSVSITADTTFHARWSVNSYQVSFSLAYDGAPAAPQAMNVTYDAVYGTLPGVAARTGYTFAGWYDTTESSAVRITSSTTVQTSAAHTLYAHWSADSYTVSFDSNGGSSVESGTATYDSTYGTLPVPTRAGYTFGGWFTSETDNNGSGTQITANSPVAVTADATLYAQWSADSYTVSFDSNGGSSVESGTATYDSTYGTLPAPTRTGYTFEGWFTSETDNNGSGTQITSSTTVAITAGATLYAQWSADSYTVSFDSNGGSNTTAITATYDSTYGTLPAPTRTGYTFEGWFTSETDNNGSGTQITSNSPVAITAGATLYAQWSADSYTVSFDSNGGSNATAITATYDSTYGTLPVPTRTGYTFEGWFTSETDNNGSGTQITSSSPVAITADTALYAQWAMTDAYIVTTDKSLLAITYAEGDSATHVTGDLTLPTSGSHGSSISWASSVTTSVRADGRVTRQSYYDGNVALTLTATVSKGSVTETKTFSLTVLCLEATDLDYVRLEWDALDESDCTYASGDSAGSVKQNFKVPVTGDYGTTISWTEVWDEHDTIMAGATDGTVEVTRPPLGSLDAEVILEGKIRKGAAYLTTRFTFTVKAVTQTELDAAAIAADTSELTFSDITFAYPDTSTAVTQNFSVPTSGSRGTTISWSEDSDTKAAVAISSDTVSVTRPTGDGSNNASVTLTATISKGLATPQEKSFSFTVLDTIAIGNSYYGYRLAVNQTNGDIFQLEGGYNNIVGVHRSSDGGQEWTTLTKTDMPTKANYGSSIAVAPDGTVYILTKIDGFTNVYSLADGAGSWVPVGNSNFISGSTTTGNPGRIVIDSEGKPYAMAENRVFELVDNVWTNTALPISGNKSDLYADGTDLYFVSYNYSAGAFEVYRRTAGSWTRLASTADNIIGYQNDYPSISASGNTVTVATVQNNDVVKVWQYNGVSWADLSSAMPVIKVTQGTTGYIQTLTVDGSSYIAAYKLEGTDNGTLLRYKDGAWSEIGSFPKTLSPALNAAYDTVNGKVVVLNSYPYIGNWKLYSITP